MPEGWGGSEELWGHHNMRGRPGKAWVIQQRQRQGEGLPLSKVHLLFPCF